MSDSPEAHIRAAQILAALKASDREKLDADFNRPSSREQHEKAYTEILNAYSANIVKTLSKKRIYKTLIFWLSFVLLSGISVGMFVLLIVLIITDRIRGVLDWCSIIAPAVVSFLTVFIVIPRVITEYLFNAEEEKYMSEIIKNIQNYDKPA